MKKILFTSLFSLLVLGIAIPSFAKQIEIEQEGLNGKIKIEQEDEGKIKVEIKTKKVKEESGKNKGEEKQKGIDRAIEVRLNALINRLEDDRRVSPEVIRNLTLFLERFRSGNGTSSTSTTDKVAPRISNLRAINVASTSAKILWNTNEPSTSNLWHGTSSSPFDRGKLPLTSSSSLVTSHSLTLTGLSPATRYAFQVRSVDEAGNARLSDIHFFRTSGATSTDTQAPSISFLSTFDITGSTTDIILVSSERTSAKVWVSATSSVSASGTPAASDASFSFFHRLNLGGLSTSTPYFYVVQVADQAENLTNSLVKSFTTLTN